MICRRWPGSSRTQCDYVLTFATLDRAAGVSRCAFMVPRDPPGLTLSPSGTSTSASAVPELTRVSLPAQLQSPENVAAMSERHLAAIGGHDPLGLLGV